MFYALRILNKNHCICIVIDGGDDGAKSNNGMVVRPIF
jgi:hypothetical protein